MRLALALALETERLLRGRPSYEVAKAVGVSGGSLSRFARGERTPSRALAERIAFELGHEPAHIFADLYDEGPACPPAPVTSPEGTRHHDRA